MPNVVLFSFEVKDGESAITPCSVMMGNIQSSRCSNRGHAVQLILQKLGGSAAIGQIIKKQS